MAAFCRCSKGHGFNAEVINENPMELDLLECPECGSEFEILEIEDEELDDLK